MGDGISPKSIVSSGTGYFSAQNMMYRHTVTIYDKNGNLIAKIPDRVDLKELGFDEYTGDSYLGGPVEAAFSNNGKTLWVSNYNMIGTGFDNPGCDGCNGKTYDPGFVYKINMESLSIEKAIKVGAVPKYLAISKDEKLMIVSNWSSGDISVVDLETETEIKKVTVGAHPRGVAISSDSKKAYITVMGSTKIACVDLVSFEVTYLENIGKSPRHVLLSDNDSLLYISLNSANSLVKYNLCTNQKQTCTTNAGPRTMILSPDQRYLYVVNYFANTFSKIDTDSMKVMEVVNTGHHPIGITANWDDSEIWVACYEGKLEIFKDFHLAEKTNKEEFIFEDELNLFLSLFQPATSSKESTAVVKKTIVPEDTDSNMNEPKDDELTVVPEKTEDKVVPKASANSVTKFDPGKYPVKTTSQNSNQSTENKISTTNNSACSYHVIVGSFSIHDNAVSFRSTIEQKGYNAILIESTKGFTYVSAACYPSREDATNAISKIYADLDVKGWVLKE